MNELSPARRRELKALAHHLDPVVTISDNGLSDAVLKEIETALRAHELIKIRVVGDDRDLRQQYLGGICEKTGASPVQSIGKLLVVWRERPADADAKPKRRARKPIKLTKRAAQTVAEGGGLPKALKRPAARKPAASKPASGKARGKR
ncbi:MAG: YhbY family RNA-binding protein [Rhodocyclaceae bacterium]|nr:YhbY family RNA-binding protein [Rhodocyclaceae bacterium]